MPGFHPKSQHRFDGWSHWTGAAICIALSGLALVGLRGAGGLHLGSDVTLLLSVASLVGVRFMPARARPESEFVASVTLSIALIATVAAAVAFIATSGR
jgi:hypothetical protein